MVSLVSIDGSRRMSKAPGSKGLDFTRALVGLKMVGLSASILGQSLSFDKLDWKAGWWSFPGEYCRSFNVHVTRRKLWSSLAPVLEDTQRGGSDDTFVGPPPPSPPASVEQDEPPDVPTLRHTSDPVIPPSVSSDLTSRVRKWGSSAKLREAEHPLSHLSHPAFPMAPGDSHEFSQRSSIDTARLSTHTSHAGVTIVPRALRISPQSDGSAITADTPVTDIPGSPPSQHALQFQERSFVHRRMCLTVLSGVIRRWAM
ncbi:hypothetical protein EDD16DRAFT_1891660 [Pisolithus croceorrhizus]|nr:hypothetical protein EDD16DRAFT_1891660 [Pisolithus croceorrhizus]